MHNAKKERNHNVATMFSYDIDIGARFDLSGEFHLVCLSKVVDK